MASQKQKTDNKHSNESNDRKTPLSLIPIVIDELLNKGPPFVGDLPGYPAYARQPQVPPSQPPKKFSPAGP